MDGAAQDAVEKVREVLGAHLEAPADDAADLWETGLIDSFMLVEIIAGLEKSFGVELGFDSLTRENFASIASIAATMRRLKS